MPVRYSAGDFIRIVVSAPAEMSIQVLDVTEVVMWSIDTERRS